MKRQWVFQPSIDDGVIFQGDVFVCLDSIEAIYPGDGGAFCQMFSGERIFLSGVTTELVKQILFDRVKAKR